MTNIENIKRNILKLSPWYYNLEIMPGIWTNPEGKRWGASFPKDRWDDIRPFLPLNDTSGNILDVGCNAGFFCRELARLGFQNIIGIEVDDRLLEQARLVRKCSGHKYDLKKLSVYDVTKLDKKYDFVLFMGVLYHLRHPLLALDELRKVTVGHIIIQSNIWGNSFPNKVPENISLKEMEEVLSLPGFPACYFIEHALGFQDYTNWWIPNPECFRAMLRNAGFKIVKQISEDCLLCG